jgi:membrane protein implicated in regulation of membrane protease activity
MNIELWHICILLALVLFIIEIFTSSFVFASFGFVFLSCALLSFFELSSEIQVLIFISCILICFLILKLFRTKFSNQGKKKLNQELKILIGREAIVTEEINNRKNSGKIILSGSNWNAKSEFGEIIPKDSFVKVLKINHPTIVVKTISE